MNGPRSAPDKLLGKRISVVLDSLSAQKRHCNVGYALSFEWHLPK
jgi:hypothetical protein